MANNDFFVSATAANGTGNDAPLPIPTACRMRMPDPRTARMRSFVFLDGTYNFATLNGGRQRFTLGADAVGRGNFDNGNTVSFRWADPADECASGNFGSLSTSVGRTAGAAP